MPDQLLQRPILTEGLEILQAIAPGGVQQYEALYTGPFVETTLALFDRQVPVGAVAQAQAAERLYHQR